MNNRLLTYLKNHEASERIIELKLDKELVNTEDENKQTPLQIAAEYGRFDIVLLLLSEGAEIRTVNDNVRYRHPLIIQLLAACSEKKADPTVIAGIYCYALNRNARVLSERMIKYLPPSANSEAKFTSRQKKSYQYAEKKQESMMVHGCDNKIENYATLFAHAFSVKNYDVLRTILNGCPNHLALLEEFLTSDQNECARFLIVSTAMDLYETALNLHKNKMPLLEKLIRIAWNSEGLLQGLIEKSIMKDTLPAADILALIKTLQQLKREDVNLLFERAVSQRYQLQFTVKSANQLSKEENELVYNLGCRLNLSILRHDEDELKSFIQYFPADLHDIILAYCDSKTQKELNGSSFFKTRMALGSKPAEAKKSAQVLHLNTRLRVLNEFITAADQELAGKTRWSHCGQLYRFWDKLLFIISLGVALVSSGVVAYTDIRTNALKELLRVETDNINGFSCYHASQGTYCLSGCVSCPEYQTLTKLEVGFGIGLGLSCFFLMIMLPGTISAFRNQQPRRFNDLSLLSYNAHTRSAAESMFSEFKGTLFNPFETNSLESKVSDVLTIARRERDTKQAQLASLTENNNDNQEEESDEKNEEWGLLLR